VAWSSAPLLFSGPDLGPQRPKFHVEIPQGEELADPTGTRKIARMAFGNALRFAVNRELRVERSAKTGGLVVIKETEALSEYAFSRFH